MFIRNLLISELIVTDLTASIDSWVTQLGFDIAYLDLQGAQVIL